VAGPAVFLTERCTDPPTSSLGKSVESLTRLSVTSHGAKKCAEVTSAPEVPERTSSTPQREAEYSECHQSVAARPCATYDASVLRCTLYLRPSGSGHHYVVQHLDAEEPAGLNRCLVRAASSEGGDGWPDRWLWTRTMFGAQTTLA